jgi:hypothetical protein
MQTDNHNTAYKQNKGQRSMSILTDAEKSFDKI